MMLSCCCCCCDVWFLVLSAHVTVQNIDEIVEACPTRIGIKQLLMVVEMAQYSSVDDSSSSADSASASSSSSSDVVAKKLVTRARFSQCLQDCDLGRY